MKHPDLDQSIDNEPRVKVLIDADVLLEFFINRRDFVEDVEKLLAEIETSRQVEMYVTNKCLKRIRLEEGLSENAALLIEEIFCGRVITISNAIRDEARTYSLPDFDSAEEVACAKNEQLNAIITLNPQNFDGSTLPIWSVANLLERVSLEKSLEKACEHQDLVQRLCMGSFTYYHFAGHGTFHDTDVSNMIKITEESISNAHYSIIIIHACSSDATKTFRNMWKDCTTDSFTTGIDLENLKRQLHRMIHPMIREISDDPTDAHTISIEPENQVGKWAELNQVYLEAPKLFEENEIDASLNSDSDQQSEESG